MAIWKDGRYSSWYAELGNGLYLEVFYNPRELDPDRPYEAQVFGYHATRAATREEAQQAAERIAREALSQALAALNSIEGGKEYTANHNATAEANARLIAAAPDMLAVLRMVDALGLREFPGGPDDPFTIADIAPHSLDLWRAARAAIAKATGEND